MERLKSNQPTYFDVDDTLVKWNPSKEELDERGVLFEWTYSDGKHVVGRILPHLLHIEQLKRHSIRGHTIYVWSAGGEEWANAICKALGIEDYVDYTTGKPIWCYDDKKADEFITTKWMEDK